jgi:hypothetical protein
MQGRFILVHMCASVLCAVAAPCLAGTTESSVPRSAEAAARPLLSEEERRPPTEGDVRELMRVLEALRREKTAGAAVKGLAEGRPFSKSRFAVLIGDMRAVLLGLHARDMRARGGIDAMPAETRNWLDAGLGAMQDCGRDRFDTRGGAAAFDRAQSVILKYRNRLEPLVLEAVPRGGAYRDGPPKQESAPR